MRLYPQLYSEPQARKLVLNRQVFEVAGGLIAPKEMALDHLLRCTWNPDWELKRALHRLVERGQVTAYRRDELLLKFCDDVPPHIKADEEPQELSDDIRWLSEVGWNWAAGIELSETHV